MHTHTHTTHKQNGITYIKQDNDTAVCMLYNLYIPLDARINSRHYKKNEKKNRKKYVNNHIVMFSLIFTLCTQGYANVSSVKNMLGLISLLIQMDFCLAFLIDYLFEYSPCFFLFHLFSSIIGFSQLNFQSQTFGRTHEKQERKTWLN